MDRRSQEIPLRTAGEWSFQAERAYDAPFADVHLDAHLTSPSGKPVIMPAFYDGEDTWRVRFNPNEVGTWRLRTVARVPDAGLEQQLTFDVVPNESRGFVKATPDRGWGFSYENGDPIFIFGDTVYHLFGMAHVGIDVVPFMERRATQGFDLLRVRVPVSPFHPPVGHNLWQDRSLWPWGGSPQAPRFDQIDVDYFRAVDRVIKKAEELGLGLELIMEGWGFEFPFNSRQIFLPEWEELWLRYLIARYDASPATWFWTPLNEYEYYPNGDFHYQPVADRWLLRTARWIKANAPHGHPVAAHNGPRLPPFAQRFANDPSAVDLILFQDWGSRGEDDGWLAAGIEETIDASLASWQGSAVFAEWGYERNPAFDLNVPAHEFCDADHTRRGAWRGAFRAMGLIHGFENSWGPWALLDEDQRGLTHLLQVRRFFTGIVPFANLCIAPDAIEAEPAPLGMNPQALANETRDRIVVYLPVGGSVDVMTAIGASAEWFDPRTGDRSIAHGEPVLKGLRFTAPPATGLHPDDWVLVVSASG